VPDGERLCPAVPVVHIAGPWLRPSLPPGWVSGSLAFVERAACCWFRAVSIFPPVPVESTGSTSGLLLARGRVRGFRRIGGGFGVGCRAGGLLLARRGPVVNGCAWCSYCRPVVTSKPSAGLGVWFAGVRRTGGLLLARLAALCLQLILFLQKPAQVRRCRWPPLRCVPQFLFRYPSHSFRA